LKWLERTGARRLDLQGHLAWIDRPDLLAWHVPKVSGLLGRDGQAVKDVALLIAFNLRDRANDDAIRGDHVPPLLDLQPRDRISHYRRNFGHPARSRSSASSGRGYSFRGVGQRAGMSPDRVSVHFRARSAAISHNNDPAASLDRVFA
jgi:hypothetical protein